MSNGDVVGINGHIVGFHDPRDQKLKQFFSTKKVSMEEGDDHMVIPRVITLSNQKVLESLRNFKNTFFLSLGFPS